MQKRLFVQNFLSHRTEKTPGNHSVFQKISGGEKYFMDERGGGITIFRRSFCLTVPKFFIREHFGVSEKFFYRKFSCIGGGGITVLSHRTAKGKLCKGKGILPFSGNFRVSKKNMDKRGLITIFIRNFYVSQCRKLFLRESYCF